MRRRRRRVSGKNESNELNVTKTTEQPPQESNSQSVSQNKNEKTDEEKREEIQHPSERQSLSTEVHNEHVTNILNTPTQSVSCGKNKQRVLFSNLRRTELKISIFHLESASSLMTSEGPSNVDTSTGSNMISELSTENTNQPVSSAHQGFVSNFLVELINANILCSSLL
jgi:hypothetical protein